MNRKIITEIGRALLRLAPAAAQRIRRIGWEETPADEVDGHVRSRNQNPTNENPTSDLARPETGGTVRVNITSAKIECFHVLKYSL